MIAKGKREKVLHANFKKIILNKIRNSFYVLFVQTKKADKICVAKNWIMRDSKIWKLLQGMVGPIRQALPHGRIPMCIRQTGAELVL